MSVIFSSDFNSGNLNDWTGHANAVLRRKGCQGSYCLTCSGFGPNNQNIWQEFGPEYTAGTIRAQVAQLEILNGGTGFTCGFLFVQNAAFGSFQFIADWTPTGQMEFQGSGGGPTSHTTPTPVLPVDGTWHTWQLGFTFYPVNIGGGLISTFGDFVIVVDNVVMDTFTMGISPVNHGGPAAQPGVWNHIGFGAATQAVGGRQGNFAFDNVEIEDTSLITAMVPCPTVPLTATTCSAALVANVTSMSIDCVTGRVTLTGTNFAQNPTVDLQGPQGQSIAFTLVSQTLTQIVLQLTDPFVSGQYCATVTNGL